MQPRAGGSLQKRVESTALGRGVISVAILFTLLAMVVTNLPDSQLRRSLSEKTQPYLNAIGLDQNWGVFAPDPRREVLWLEGKIVYADGSEETWRPPVRNDLVGELSDYRWQKFMENVISEGGPGLLTKNTAAWIARERRTRREAPVRVVLTRRSAPLAPPGPQADDPLTFTESELVSLDITEKILSGDVP